MKKISTLLFFVFIYQFAYSQAWKQLDSLSEARNRSGAFSIGGKGYVVAGGNSWYLQTAWSYDTASNTWASIAPFPSDDDDGAVGFTINGIGYMGTGAYCCYEYGNEFYSYTPGNNTWTALPNFPGQGRSFAVAFALDGKGYIGGGLNGYNNNALNDFYSYDPVKNSWTQIANCPASGVSLRAVAFTIGDKAFVGTGGAQQGGAGSSSFVPTKDFWEYDTTSKAWTQVADFGGGTRWLATAFATCDKGYVGTGVSDANQSVYTNDFWQYDPVKNTWTQIADFGGTGRESMSAFVIGQTGYICCGANAYGVNGGLWSYKVSYTPAFSAISATCAGDAITFTDTSNYSPTNWSWSFPGGTPSTSTKQNPTVVYNASGSYDVTFTAYNGCDSATETFTKYVTVAPALNVGVAPLAPLVCNGQHLLLTASGGTTYQWVGTTNTKDTITISPTKDTTYEVIVGNGTCTKDTFISVKASNPPPLTVQPQFPTLCNGQNVVLKADNASGTITWSPSAGLSASTGDSVICTPGYDVIYTVTGTDSLGCSASGTDMVDVIPSPNKPTFYQHGDTLISSSRYDNQWYRNDTLLVNGTGQDLIITSAGNKYYVVVQNEANGCTAPSDTVQINVVNGINQLSAISNQLSVYPNPFNSNLFIKINSSVSDVGDWAMQFTDVLGRTLYSTPSLNYSNEIDLSDLANGVYFITIVTKTGRAVMPVVKQ